ncbi:efflux transporter periplasmic adaptor subunit, partial [Enterobacter cloacae complex sp. 742-ADZ3-9B]
MKTITTSIAALLLLTGCDNAQTSAPQRPLPEVGIVTLMS